MNDSCSVVVTSVGSSGGGRAVPDLGLGMGTSVHLSPLSADAFWFAPISTHDYITKARFVVFRQRINPSSKQHICRSSCSLSAVTAGARASPPAACKTIARQAPRVNRQYATPH